MHIIQSTNNNKEIKEKMLNRAMMNQHKSVTPKKIQTKNVLNIAIFVKFKDHLKFGQSKPDRLTE